VLANSNPNSPHTALRDAATAHAGAGFHLIPLKAGQKARRTHKGTQPSCDPAVVRRWWTSMPDSNIGIVLDHLLIVVLDVDGPIGRDSLARLLALAGLDHLPATYTVTTGRPDGGRHHWFRLPPGAVKLWAPRCSEWLTAIVTSLSLRSWGHDRA